MPSLEKMAKAARAKPKPTAKPSKVVLKKAVKPIEAFKSSEFIESSDESEEEVDESEEEVPVLKTAPKAVPVLRPQAVEEDPSSDEGSGSGSEEEESESESEDGDEMALDAPTPPPVSILKKTPAEPPKPISKPRAQEPALPPNFKPLPLPSSSTPTAASTLFHKTNLEEKEIWYFTAPSSIPLSALSGKISLKEGNTIIHNGSSYTFAEGRVSDGTKILLPKSKEGGYKSSSKPITRTHHLQLLPQLPGVTISGPSPTATIPTPKPVRPQPKGMRMRFYPIGVIPTPNDHPQSDDEEAEIAFQVPSAEGLDSDVEMSQPTKSISKRKNSTNGDEKRSKKQKTSNGEGKRKEKKSVVEEAVPDRQETREEKEERRKKRKEKKARKA